MLETIAVLCKTEKQEFFQRHLRRYNLQFVSELSDISPLLRTISAQLLLLDFSGIEQDVDQKSLTQKEIALLSDRLKSQVKNIVVENQLPCVAILNGRHLRFVVGQNQIGIADYVTHPINRDELIWRVRHQIDSYKKTQQIAAFEAVNREREIQEQASDEEAQLEQYFQIVHEPLMTMAKSGDILYLNRGGAKLTGISEDLHDEAKVTSLVPPDAEQDHPLRLHNWHDLVSSNQETQLLKADLLVKICQSSDQPRQPLVISDVKMLFRTLKLKKDYYVLVLELPDTANQIRAIEKFSRATGRDGQLILADNETEEACLNYRQQVVSLMQLSLNSWEISTGKTKIDLAEQSEVWAVTIDDGRLRTRTMDRYLKLTRLPKTPRWREVIRTARYVENHADLTDEMKLELQLATKGLLNVSHELKSA